MIRNILTTIAIAATIAACGAKTESVSKTFSLSGDDFTGKKFYLGWGAAGSGDPQMMHNEVKYDVLHTHDIFTKNVGGNYTGIKDTGSSVSASSVRARWAELKSQMTAADMYVQYSSGHGSPSGLGIGLSYSQIRDNALSYPAKEIIIFTMACNSGGLVNSFNSVRSQWQDWGSRGRALLVMSSSTVNENSSTGPGRDPDEVNGPEGSAGSAFGHSLWKALIGYADGYIDGVKDGYITLEEIVEFTKWKTQEVGGHSPQVTGVYNANVIMNRVPPRSFLDALEHSTEGMTDAEVATQVAALDEAMRVAND